MATPNILVSMTEKYNSFTRLGKQLADYCFDHTREVEYLSITSLAELSGVSEATITRFCRQLGLRGYNEFKLALAKTDHLTDMGDSSDAPNGLTSEDSLDSIFQKLYSQQTVSLTESLNALNAQAVSRAADILSEANRVYCFGSGGSMVIAMEAWARFSTVTNQFIHIADSHMQALAASLCTSGDAILFFSYSGATRELEDVFQIARKAGVPLILVTHYPNTPAAEMADVTLLCGGNESPLQSGSIAAKIGQMFVIECLYYAYCRKNPERTSLSRAATAQAVASKLL